MRSEREYFPKVDKSIEKYARERKTTTRPRHSNPVAIPRYEKTVAAHTTGGQGRNEDEFEVYTIEREKNDRDRF